MCLLAPPATNSMVTKLTLALRVLFLDLLRFDSAPALILMCLVQRRAELSICFCRVRWCQSQPVLLLAPPAPNSMLKKLTLAFQSLAVIKTLTFETLNFISDDLLSVICGVFIDRERGRERKREIHITCCEFPVHGLLICLPACLLYGNLIAWLCSFNLCVVSGCVRFHSPIRCPSWAQIFTLGYIYIYR